MQKNTSKKTENRLIDRIINVAYGDAGIFDKSIVAWKAANDEKVRNLLEEYRSTAGKIRELRDEVLPDYVIENVNSRISAQTTDENFVVKLSNSLFTFLSRTAVPISAAGIIVIAVVSFLIFNEPAPPHKYSQEEIELAESQLKQSLAIVGKVFTKAEKEFSQEILNKQINKTLNKGYYLVNNILTGG